MWWMGICIPNSINSVCYFAKSLFLVSLNPEWVHLSENIIHKSSHTFEYPRDVTAYILDAIENDTKEREKVRGCSHIATCNPIFRHSSFTILVRMFLQLLSESLLIPSPQPTQPLYFARYSSRNVGSTWMKLQSRQMDSGNPYA